MNKNLLTSLKARGLAPIAIILIVIGFSVAASLGLFYYFDLGFKVGPGTPPGSDAVTKFEFTESWQTYRNEEHGFEFKYPSMWVVKDTSKGAGYALFEVSIYPVDPDKYCAELQSEPDMGFVCGVSPAIVIYKNKNDSDKEPIIRKFPPETAPFDEKISDQILSTFKFTK